MPRVPISEQAAAPPATWQQMITDRIRSDKVVPIISNSVGNEMVLGGQDALAEAYALYSRYPPNQDPLSQMAQFKGISDPSIADALALKDDYINFVKNRLFDIAEAADADADILAEVEEQFDALFFSEFCNQLGYPQFDEDREHPFLLLAALELPIYITTGYHDFLEQALRRNGKDPKSEVCRWHKSLEKIPSVFGSEYEEPTRNQPLVYHLYGFDKYPASLVLTEDDHLQFLVAASQNVGRDDDPVHKRVRQAMSDSSLMLLGYGLQEWDFRALFWGLIVPRTQKLTSVVSIQLEPSDREKQYLDKYLDGYDFKVTWQGADEYMRELYRAVRNG